MKKNICCALAVMVLVMSGCGSHDKYDEASADENVFTEEPEETIQEEPETIIQEEPQKNIPEETEEVPQETEVLRFVDVFREEYETTIKADVPGHNYLNAGFRRDGDILTYEDDRYTSRLGVDVSKHQGKIDWEKVRSQGVEFAFLRIGYRGYGQAGTINPDERFYENIEGAQAAGIDVGVYFFSQAINEDEALEEARFVVDSLKGYELQLPVVYDPESILDDVARTDDVSGEQFTRNTIVFCDSIKENGYVPMIYSNMLWEAFEFDLSKLTDIPVWYADYEELPQTPYNYVFWQYTNEGRISGIDGYVDLDIQMVKKQG